MACTTTYAEDLTNCERWQYRNTKNECVLCPGDEYRTGEKEADIKINEIDNEDLIIKADDLSTYFENRPNAYPNEIQEIQKVWFSPRNNEATSISECMLSYSIKNDRGIFVLDGVKYNENDRKYNTTLDDSNKIYYTEINAGYYGNNKYYDYCTENRYKYYMDAVVCPAGKYCTGLNYNTNTNLKCSAGNYTYNMSFGIDDDIAAEYYSTGGATKADPSTTDCVGADTSCGPCPVATCQATCQNDPNCTKCKDNETYHRTTYPRNYYADENLTLIQAWFPSSSKSKTGKKSITECTISYEYENDRGIFNHESVSYNNETNKYDTGGGAVYYTKINAGYYGETNLWGSAAACLNKIQYFQYAKPCPPGKYCNGRTEEEMAKCTDPNADWNQNEKKYIDGDIAAGYYSTGGGTSDKPEEQGNGCLVNYQCGKTAPGYYSTGGGTLAEPKEPGNGCLSGYSCGQCTAGTYCGGGTQTNENTTCDAGYYCPAGSERAECPTGTTSKEGSDQKTDCYYAKEQTLFCNEEVETIGNKEVKKIGKCFYITENIHYSE